MQSVFPLHVLLCFLLSSFCLSEKLWAQNQETRTLVADLSQDIALMDRQIRSLSLEIDILKDSQGEAWNRSSLRAFEIKLNQMSNDLNALKIALSDQEKRIKKAVLDEVTKQIDGYISNINSKLGFANESGSKTIVNEVFSSNYPKSGLSYEVQAGDTLSQIAIYFGTKVDYIQNANQIKDPAKDLRVGDIIFIPLTKE